MIKIIFLSILLLSGVVNAQNSYVDKNFEINLKQSGKYVLLSFDLKNDTKLYWRNPGELGLATKIEVKKSNNLDAAKVFWPVPELYKVEDTTSYIYTGKQTFVIEPSIINDNKDAMVSLNIKFTTCNKLCSNHQIKLATIINNHDKDLITEEAIQALGKTPHANDSEGIKFLSVTQKKIEKQYWLKIKLISEAEQISPKIFFDLPEYVSFDPAKFTLSREGDNIQVIDLPVNLVDKSFIDPIYLLLVTDNGHVIEYDSSIEKKSEYSFWWIIFYALIGGFILNFMPCVLPVLALKALQLVKLSNKKNGDIRTSLIAQSIGIIASFIFIALSTYVLQQLGQHVGLGIQFQQPLYLITMVIILSIISINLVENIELNFRIPSAVYNFFISEKSNFLSFFFTGVLSTMLAIPCTAPFITIAIGFALTADLSEMLIIFFVIGIGMSIPYIVLALFPKAAKLLPKPGVWMDKFKKILGVFIFLTSLWLIYVISTQLGDKAAITLFLLIILIKFVLTDKKIFKGIFKISSIIMLLALCYFIPQQLHEEKKQEVLLIEDVWMEYKPNEIDTLIKNDHIILLDVTASWCATCKINKITTLDNSVVMDYMKKRDIIGMRADISAGNTKEVSELMKIHKHYGIPLCIIYSKKFPEGMVLPTFLTPNSLISSLKKASYEK